MTAALAKSDLTPFFALDRLNSWIRAEHPWYCVARSTFKPVIYWTKTKAILEATKVWQVPLRRVMVKKPCRSCSGTGSWLSDRHYICWEEGETLEEARANYGERCRTCRGKGIVTLKFVESTIGPIRWHTPIEKWVSSSLDVYVPFPAFYASDDDEGYVPADNWQPCQPGRPMVLEDVRRDMLILLEAFPKDVAFSVEYHEHLGLSYHAPDLGKVERWIRGVVQKAVERL